MANENLIRLIEQTSDIKKRFKTEYISLGKPAGKPAIQTPYQTIHNDEKYLRWKAEIEAELEKIPQSKTVQDIIRLFSKMGKNFSDDSTFAQLSLSRAEELCLLLIHLQAYQDLKDQMYKMNKAIQNK